MKTILNIAMLCIAAMSYGQHSKEFESLSARYPESRLVRLNKEVIINISQQEDQLYITQDILEEDMYMDESAIGGSKRALNFSSFFEIDHLEASSFVFTNGKYKEHEVREFKEKDELDDVFYDDTKSINFIFPNLKKGAKSRLKYREIVKNPRFLGAFYFADFFPVLNKKLVVIADKTIDLDFKTFNLDTLDLIFNKKERRKTIEYSWELKNSPEYKYESNTPSYKTILPHIVPIIKSYQINGKTIRNLEEVSDLYAWYQSMVKDINTSTPSEEMVAIVEAITKGKTSDLEKVKAIFYWVQQNIKYVAFEYALGGFIPREANDVLNKKYGDCKDNSSILSEMLEIAGLKGRLTWIGTRDIPYKYEELPTPSVDNHMILTYIDKGKPYFLDATGRYIPFGFPTSFIQGKEALVEDGTTDWQIINVPIVDANKNALIDSTEIRIDGDKIIGRSKSHLSGYLKIDAYHDLENIKTLDDLKTYYNDFFIKGNNAFLIKDLSEENKFDYDKDLSVNYSFEIKDYSKQLKDEIYINLNLNRVASALELEEERQYDLEYRYKALYSFTNTLTIPEGYVVDYVPENTHFTNDYVSIYTNYETLNNAIVYRHSVKFNFLSLNLTQQKEVKNLIKKANKSYKKIVVLKRI
ncbi:MAG: DUF3857 domain-containing protein [Bacteroidota bacterium]